MMNINTLIGLFILTLLSSCNNYYFNAPQPEDSKNSYTIPNKYRGTWYLDKNKSTKLTIGKDFYRTTEREQMIKSKAKMDLDPKTYFIGNKIYYSEGDKYESRELLGGFNYVLKGDSVIVEFTEINHIEFGQNAFLRKFEYGYILNSKHAKMNDWWNLLFIDTRNKKGMTVLRLDREDLNKIENYEMLHEDFSNYFIAKWTKKNLQYFIDNGGFSDMICFLKYKEKIKN